MTSVQNFIGTSFPEMCSKRKNEFVRKMREKCEKEVCQSKIRSLCCEIETKVKVQNEQVEKD